MNRARHPDVDPALLRPTPFLDFDRPEVAAFARSAAGDGDPAERAVRLFYAVRDGVRYDPYAASVDPSAFRASTVLRERATFCVPKAILLAAAARAESIPSRLAFADVRNHLATARLLGLLRTDVFAFHGYTELWLHGRWVKATPTFNLSLCEKFGVRPLEFDGRHDATLHPYDRRGQRHMEYLVDRGSHTDLPLQEMVGVLREAYPHFFDDGGRFAVDAALHDFEREAAAERGDA